MINNIFLHTCNRRSKAQSNAELNLQLDENAKQQLYYCANDDKAIMRLVHRFRSAQHWSAMIKCCLAISEDNNSEALYYLALYYGQIKDHDNMIKYLLLVAGHANANAHLQARIDAYVQARAQKGEDEGAYENPDDYADAIEDPRADEDVHVKAMNALGKYYGSIQDQVNEEKYYSLADKHNSVIAMNNLGTYYERRLDYDNAEDYYIMAVDRDCVEAMVNLGDFYERMPERDNKQKDCMMRYYLMAINRGCTIAMRRLAGYYFRMHNYDAMIKYYLMAVSEGDAEAMNCVGDYCVPRKDYGGAIKYYLLAIKYNNLAAMNNLNNLYETIRYGPHSEALEYYSFAIDNGCALAYKYLNKLLSSIHSVDLFDKYKKYLDTKNLKAL